jgi:hypothetical protein
LQQPSKSSCGKHKEAGTAGCWPAAAAGGSSDLRPKIFALVDLCGSLLTIRLIRKICENVIYLDMTCFIIVYILSIS